jgi:hypothetical protein
MVVGFSGRGQVVLKLGVPKLNERCAIVHEADMPGQSLDLMRLIYNQALKIRREENVASSSPLLLLISYRRY